jgi:membrane protein required for colicin V production
MATFDFIILGIVLLSAIVGLVRGFLREICSLVTWVLAIWLAWRLGPLLVPYLGGALSKEPYGLWAGRTIVFVLVLVAGAIVGFLVNHFVRLSLFSGLDRMLGFLLGVVRGVVIVAMVIILAQVARLDDEGWWQRSRLVPALTPVATLLRAMIGEYLPADAAREG